MQVKKRDGRIVEFEHGRIKSAIIKAMSETVMGIDEKFAQDMSVKVMSMVYSFEPVSTEKIHDKVEEVLMASDRKDVAKAYILYRQSRLQSKKTTNYKLLDDDFISKYKHLPSNMSPLGEFVYYRTYSRYLKDERRREYWWETVRRAVEYNCSLVPTTTKEEAQSLFDNMFHMKQFLSGRTMWVGGTSVSKSHPMSNFNCAFQVVDSLDSFSDLFYLLMLGSGVGVRLLKEDIEKLPSMRSKYTMIHEFYSPIAKVDRKEHTSLTFNKQIATIEIGDSKNGWVDALRIFLTIIGEPFYKDVDTIVFNYNSVRPSGERLKSFGGTASGHGALKDIFTKIDRVIKKVEINNSKLKPIDCLDICNIIGEGVVVGGVRRTAEIVLFDSDDEECIGAKASLYKEVEGQWMVDKSIIHRSMSNNSIFYKSKPSREKLHWQMEKMRFSGEPAFINEESASKRRDNFKGVNPCAEILLDSKGMCNLTTVNVMGFVKDGKLDLDALLNAQRLSVRAGYRMTCVDLELPAWNIVQKRDRLVGCSLTGWQDMVNALDFQTEDEIDLLKKLRKVAHDEAIRYSEALGQKEPLLITTIKPEGTLSQLPVVSSGIHYSHSPYYIRRIRVNADDPIIKVCEELGYPISPENGQSIETCKTKVVSFPVESPNGKTKYDVSAIQQLETYKMFMENYIDHNCSITVHVRDHEWEGVEAWMWDNWDSVVAVSFLSLDDNFYQQAPYESISKETYEDMKSKMPQFLPSLITKYETEETETEVTADPSCANGICPIR